MKSDSAAPSVRPLHTDDLARLVELMAQHAEHERAAFDPTDKVEQLADHLLGEPRSATCIVAEQEGLVVGYTTFSREFSTWDAGEYLHMDTLFVATDHRGAGIGALLLRHVLDVAETSDVVNTQWQTPDWNRDALRFYERFGAIVQPKIRLTVSATDKPHPSTDATSSNAHTLDRFGEAWSRQDPEAIARCLHRDCVYSPSLAAELGGKFEGAEAVLAGIELMWEHDAGSTATFGDEIETGELIVRTWTYHFDDQPDEHGIDIFSFRDGLLLSKDAYRKGVH